MEEDINNVLIGHALALVSVKRHSYIGCLS
jgi:hypothetical protein